MISESRVDQVLAQFPDGWLRRYCLWAEQQNDAPKAYHLATALAVFATVTPPEMKLDAGGRVLPTFWSLIVGDSSDSRKSSALFLGQEVLDATGLDLIGDTAGSTEGFIKSLTAKPQQLVIHAEYGDFLAKTTEGYLAPMREMMTNVYDGAALSRRTVKDATRTKMTRMSLLAAVTPEYLEEHTQHDDWTGGFLARHVIFYARRERTNTTTYARDSRSTEELAEGLKLIFARKDSVARCTGFGPAAQRLWNSWYGEVTRRFPADGVARWARGMAARAPAVALKVALFLALDGGMVPTAGEWDIPLSVLRPAMDVAEMHIESGVEIVERLVTTKYGRERRVIMDALCNGEPRGVGTLITLTGFGLQDIERTLKSMVHESVIKAVRVPGSNDWWYQIEPTRAPKYILQQRRADVPPPPDNVLPFVPPLDPAPAVSGPEAFILQAEQDDSGWTVDVAFYPD